MGDAIECEHANPDNGDTLQRTTTGLSFYRKSTNTPTFTNGSEHWGFTQDGLVFWTGSNIDPPGVVAPAANPVAQPAPSAAPAPVPAVTPPAASDPSTTAAISPAAATVPSVGSPIAFQTVSQPYDFASIHATLDPHKTYVARVRSDPPGLQLKIDTEHLTNVMVTTPWEAEVQIPMDDRIKDVRYGFSEQAYLLAAKGSIRDGTVTAEIIETGTMDVQVPADQPTAAGASSGGCGSRGGPGYRLPNGQCASWSSKP